MRIGPMLMIGGLLFSVIGCSSAQNGSPHSAIRRQTFGTGQGDDFAAALLFDRQPGFYRASDFAVRSDWPSTESFYSLGQVIYFSERFVDFQGRGFDDSHNTYRRFDTYRVGTGYR